METDERLMELLERMLEHGGGESSEHIINVTYLTESLLKQLSQMSDEYSVSEEKISEIAEAAAFHDIGKLGIPLEILNKPGKLTRKEYEIVKTHPLIGVNLLGIAFRDCISIPTAISMSFPGSIPLNMDPVLCTSCQVCRWHHERYDGSGYPDGLCGDEIPLCAQVVSVADAYDALREKRPYKEAYSHEKSLHMIREGACGAFNPLLVRCLEECGDVFRL